MKEKKTKDTKIAKIVKFLLGIVSGVIVGVIVYAITTGNTPAIFSGTHTQSNSPSTNTTPVTGAENPVIDTSEGFVLDGVYHYLGGTKDGENYSEVDVTLELTNENITGYQVYIGLENTTFATKILENDQGTFSFSCSPGRYSIQAFQENVNNPIVYSAIEDFTESGYYKVTLQQQEKAE